MRGSNTYVFTSVWALLFKRNERNCEWKMKLLRKPTFPRLKIRHHLYIIYIFFFPSVYEGKSLIWSRVKHINTWNAHQEKILKYQKPLDRPYSHAQDGESWRQNDVGRIIGSRVCSGILSQSWHYPDANVAFVWSLDPRWPKKDSRRISKSIHTTSSPAAPNNRSGDPRPARIVASRNLLGV